MCLRPSARATSAVHGCSGPELLPERGMTCCDRLLRRSAPMRDDGPGDIRHRCRDAAAAGMSSGNGRPLNDATERGTVSRSRPLGAAATPAMEDVSRDETIRSDDHARGRGVCASEPSHARAISRNWRGSAFPEARWAGPVSPGRSRRLARGQCPALDVGPRAEVTMRCSGRSGEARTRASPRLSSRTIFKQSPPRSIASSSATSMCSAQGCQCRCRVDFTVTRQPAPIATSASTVTSIAQGRERIVGFAQWGIGAPTERNS